MANGKSAPFYAVDITQVASDKLKFVGLLLLKSDHLAHGVDRLRLRLVVGAHLHLSE